MTSPSASSPPASPAHDGMRLRLLAEVSLDGRPVTGERSRALLAALTEADGRAVPETVLAEAVWGRDDLPQHPGKALQVVVSRTRSQTAPDLVVRAERGYRLGLPVEAVDVHRLGTLLSRARAGERTGDGTTMLAAATEAAETVIAPPGSEPAPLETLRAEARDRRAEAGVLRGLAASRLGRHEEAFPLLAAVAAPDEATLVALLRSEAAVHGVAAALTRYEAHRADLADQLGVDPGPDLRSLHAELLAADRPVRSGLRYAATSLVGRADDLAELRQAVRHSRVVSILGPGGLGKTRLAHLLGREAEQSVVHLVELVGVAAPEDVVGEVGAALGVRDSVTARRALTADQLRDVRGRIAQTLDQVPALLILDNCEHVVDAVADLVAFLVAVTADLRVVTTTRAPLGIAAERVFALSQLSQAEAVRLFEQRARAARPDVPLPAEVVGRVVSRLDGLPLAVELAAARVRAMSVEDVARRLDDRFALLRTTDRSAPDRHRTLLAVIAWSWDLLETSEQRALSWLALLRDGFTLPAAEALLGPGAFAAVESLVGQSLLAVREDGDGRGDALRYRMLETVREFGRLRLAESGEEDDARAARRGWAIDLARDGLARLYGRDQVAAVQDLAREDNNLGDVFHEALAEGDRTTVATLIAALGGSWTIRGAHERVIAVGGAVEEVLADWDPADAEVDDATSAATVIGVNSLIAGLSRAAHSRALLTRHGHRSNDPSVRATAKVLALVDLSESDDAAMLEGLARLAEDPDRHVALLALRWTSHWLENDGSGAAAAEAGHRALELCREEDGPWARALTLSQLAGLQAQRGELELAGRYAREALAAIDALGASDDAVQLRGLLAACAIAGGDLAEAERWLAEMEAIPDPVWGGLTTLLTTRAEVLLARGELAEGLVAYDLAVETTRRVRLPGFDMVEGQEPWRLFTESAALAAHAVCGERAAATVVADPSAPRSIAGSSDSGVELATDLASRVVAILSSEHRALDYPIAGALLFALGLWRLHRPSGEDDLDLAVELLALAERFGYSRYQVSMAWAPAAAAAEAVRPGLLTERLAANGERRTAGVREDALALLRRRL